MRQMEETIRSIKGVGYHGSVNYSELWIFLGGRYPDKFQVQEFEKYNGLGDLYNHLKIYIGKLGSYTENESLGMQLF